MAVETNTTTTEQMVTGLNIEMVENFKHETDRLMEILGLTSVEVMKAGAAMFVYRVTGELNDEEYTEGDVVPLSRYKLDKKPIDAFSPIPYRKLTTAEAILKAGYENAISKTDDKMMLHVRAGRIAEFFDFLTMGTGEAWGDNLQAALAYADSELQNTLEDNNDASENIIHFVNRNDIADYLAKAEITTQMVYGMEYIQNFLGVRNIFVTNKVAQGTVYATPAENIRIYGLDFGELSKAGLTYQTSADGLIGVAHDINRERVSAQTHVLTGMKMLAEVLDYIVVSKIGERPYPAGKPNAEWTAAQLEAYAEAKGIDLTGASTKDAKLAAILAVIEA